MALHEKSVVGLLLCATSALCVSVVSFAANSVNHRDTEDTEVAQRRARSRLLCKALRRRDPQDDLVSALIKAEEAGDKLNEDELLAMVFLLLIAGHETTVNLIGNGTLALLEKPNEMSKLRSEPSLVKPGRRGTTSLHSTCIHDQ